MDTITTITSNERTLLTRIQEGMDEPNCGWLHELSNLEGKSLSGLMSSLIKKDLITSTIDNEGPMSCYWVELTEKGIESIK